MDATIILIPGLMNDGWVWAEQLPALSRSSPVFVACNDGSASLAEMASRILGATNGPLMVAGHSMGGRVALEMMAIAPERIARLALLSTGAHGPRAEEAAGRLRLVDLAQEQGMAAVADAWMPDMLSAQAGAEARQGVRAMLCRATPQAFADQQQALLSRPDRTALLATITAPTLVATGAGDGWASPQQHAEMAAHIPGARLEIVAEAGHMLPVEAGAATTRLLADLFAS